jgi:hypothetical protein
MEKTVLKHLAANRTRPLSEMRETAPDAFEAVARDVGAERQRLLVEALTGTSDEMVRAVATLEPIELASGALSEIVERVLETVAVDEQIRAEALERAALTDRLDPGELRLDTPIEAHVALRAELGRGEIISLADRLKIRDEAVDALVKVVDSPGAVSDRTLSGLVERQELTNAEAARLGTHLSFYHLANGEAPVADALATTRFDALNGNLQDVRDVLRLSVDEIAGSLHRAGVVPEGDTPELLAGEIRARVVDRFPTEELLRRLEPPTANWLTPRLTRVTAVLADQRNRERFGADAGELDFSTVPQAERQATVAAYEDLVKLTRRYPGLGIDAVLVEGGDGDSVSRAIAARIALIDNTVKQNPNTQFLALDYSADSADVRNLNMTGIGASERVAVLSAFKAQQRVFAVAGTPDDTIRLLEAGYHSAVAIAADDVETFQTKTRLTAERALVIHNRAAEAMAGITSIIGGILDVIRGEFGRMPVGNIADPVSDALRRIAGYADLFGPQENCRCSHCSSILSPAAYFVDLMYFVEEHVLSKVFTGAKASHALNLSIRRPDLWTLDLTCDNTHTLLPTLDVINEILEAYLAKRRDPAISLANRAAVRQLVYGNILPNTKASFKLPFVLPIATADAYAELFELSRAEILRILGAPQQRVTAAALRMAKQTYDVVLTADTDIAFLRSLYRITFSIGAGSAIAAVNVQDLLRATEVTREELGGLVRSRFVTAAGANPVTLRAEKRSPDSVQNDVEQAVGLTTNTLDRMHRFLRLWRHTSWGIEELDLVLEQHAAAAAPTIDHAALASVVAVQDLTVRFGISVEVACALWSDIPTREVATGRRSLFDRLFNNRPYTLTEGNLPKDGTTFVVPAFRTAPSPGADNTLQRLLLGLQVDDAELAALVIGLAAPLGSNPSAPSESDRGFALSLRNLSLLYRHARLAKLLKRPVRDLFQLTQLAGIPDGAVRSMAELQTLLAFDAWMRTSGLGLDDIALVTGRPVRNPERYPSAAGLAADLIAAVTADESLTFVDTVLAFVPSVTEDVSRQIIAQNPMLFDVLSDGRLRLAAGVAPSAEITAPPGTAPVSALRAVLMRYHTSNVLPPRLAAALGVPTEKLAELAAMAGVDLGHSDVTTALHGGPLAPIQAAIAALLRLTVLFKHDTYTRPQLAFIRDAPGLFGVTSFTALTVANVQAITRYRQLSATPLGDPTTPAPSAAAVNEALSAFTSASKFSAVTSERLAQALATEPAVAAVLPGAAVLGNDAVGALSSLAAAVALIRQSGLDVSSITLLASENTGDLAAGAEALVSALTRIYPDEKDVRARLEPMEDRLRSLKRDALADVIIRGSGGRFDTLDDLYDYFLLDVQLQGCARTSRVVAAISSVQAYVHRILLNLEQDRRDAEASDQVHVLPERIPADEWSWRKNYRVWEANRKVFLWPENYLEPELRDDKTPLFRSLEENLLQQDINEQNVLDAYGDYLSGFEALANVAIAGAYHEFHDASQTDILHVFGVTPEDPPDYYYWTINNLYYSRTRPDRRISYSARTKIDVSIPVRRVTPVVYFGRLYVFWTEIQTRSENRVRNGNSEFSGYKHQVRIKSISLRLDGRWTAPQEVAIDRRLPFRKGGIVFDYLTSRGPGTSNIPAFATAFGTHSEYQEGYTLEGSHWERVTCEPIWDNQLFMNLGGFAPPIHTVSSQGAARVDLFERQLRNLNSVHTSGLLNLWNTSRNLLHVGEDGSNRRLYAPSTGPHRMAWEGWLLGPSAMQQIVADIKATRSFIIGQGFWSNQVATRVQMLGLDNAQRGTALATLQNHEAVASGVAGSPGGAGLILEAAGDALYILRNPASTGSWLGMRIGTTLVREMSRLLFVGGIDQLLNITTQQGLGEAHHLVSAHGGLMVAGPVGRIDFDGPLGVYYREVFFHIPFLLANNLNARQNYKAAQDWYHYIFDPTAPTERLETRVVSGSTTPGATNWQPYGNNAGIYCDVDTSQAGLTETPIYLASLIGSSHHWELTGITAIYSATPRGFRIYLRSAAGGTQPTPQQANQRRWAVQWQAVPRSRFSGSTTPGATNWQPYGNNAGIYCDVDTSQAELTETPIYLASLIGNNSHWSLTGINAIYSATPRGFRIYLRSAAGGAQPTPEQANQRRWAVQWVAVPRSRFSGSTTPGATNWQPYGNNAGIYCDVDTSQAGLTETPIYLASLIGSSHHWELTGITAIYSATPRGFRIYLRSATGGAQPTPQQANQRSWAVQWMATSRVIEASQVSNENDRVWRYLQFRGLTPPRLRDILTDEQAIEAYKKDPFNPHAIARLRLSAYQKSVVMKYVTNLIDWGDSLFTQFTMESVNEASVLYALASEILGRRPADVGECGTSVVEPRSYENIRPAIAKGSEFVLEVESVLWIGPKAHKYKQGAGTSGQFLVYARAESDLAASQLANLARTDAPAAAALVGMVHTAGASAETMLSLKLLAGAGAMVAGAENRAFAGTAPTSADAVRLVEEGLDPSPSKQLDWKRTRTAGWVEHNGRARQLIRNDRILLEDFHRIHGFGWSLVRQLGPVFCVPENKDLLSLWGRVEDRLYKIRHCLDITGARRDLALFAPEIDPRLLVRARAEGLSIEDVLGASSGNLPPYRFAFLIEKAKQYAATAQSFGSQLLGALEKRDMEQLTRLRNTQQLNVLKLTTRLREWEVQIARDAVEQLNRQKAAIEYRRDYYRNQLDTDLLPWERTQQVLRHSSSVFYGLGAVLGGTAGVVHLIPQLGSPFAMKYGGKETGMSLTQWSAMFSDTAKLLDVAAASAGLEAGFERRREGWDHQRQLAEHELRQLEKQLSAASLRVQIAERSVELHTRNIEEQEEIIEFFQDRFSNLGLYVWLSTSLQRLYRQVFNAAQSMARLAERAYRFERNDEATSLLSATYWHGQHAGLLAGEALMADLLELERRFVETNYRTLEIDQAFSVMQLSPQALLALRETGECEVTIPEVAFDFYYPGHYRRRIRAVRLTIPSVTGPYTNVAATLTLKRSFIRRDPQPGAANLVEVPLRHSVSVATSTAQSDAGVFDFSFRDERYMPFEGAGVVSTWTLSLPKNFRPFNYDTITDVILNISYTALADGVLRQRVEDANAALEGTIASVLSSEPLARAVSLRQEFSAVFQRAMLSPPGTQVHLDIDDRFLPIFLRGRAINISRALLLLRPAEGLTGAGFSVRLNNFVVNSFAAAPQFPGYRQADIQPAFATGLLGRHVFSIEAGGDLSPTPPVPGSPAVCDPAKLSDLVLYVEVTM